MAEAGYMRRFWRWLTTEQQPPKQAVETVADSVSERGGAEGASPSTKRVKPDGKLILFVHGLAGSPASTWSSMLGVLESDPSLKSFGYDCYSFPTGFWRPPLGTRMPRIQDLAEGLRTHIDIHYPSVEEIFIIAHSLGGVVSRQLILDCRKGEIAIPFAGVMLIASPHGGTSLAALGNFLSAGHKHLAQLTEESDIIDLINRDWQRLKIEDTLSTMYVVGGIDAVVAPSSAAPYSGRRNVLTLIGYGHTDILEPVDELDTRYKVVQNFLLGVKAVQEKTTSQIPIPLEVEDPLFDQYSASVEAFYYCRPHDRALSMVGRGRAAWIMGPAGSGKTVALFRRALQSDSEVHSISLDTVPGLSSHALLCEICSALSERAGVGFRYPHDTTVLKLSDEIKNIIPAIGIRVSVIIEEIPLSEGDGLSSFISIFAKFIQNFRNSGNGWEVMWLISSLGDPKRGLGARTGKVLDTVEVVPIEAWSVDALHELYKLLGSSVEYKVSQEDLSYLLHSAKGSPRFLKIALRQKRGQPHRSLHELVEELRVEWSEI